MKNLRSKILSALFFAYVVIISLSSVYYARADFGRGESKLYAFVIAAIVICDVLFCQLRFIRAVPFVFASTALQIPAIILYTTNSEFHFNMAGIRYSMASKYGFWGHLGVFILGLTLGVISWRDWQNTITD